MSPQKVVLTNPAISVRATVVFAADQPQYRALPAVVGTDWARTVTTRWRLTWRERWKLFWCGEFWHQQLSFGSRLQPILIMVDEPTAEECGLRLGSPPGPPTPPRPPNDRPVG